MSDAQVLWSLCCLAVHSFLICDVSSNYKNSVDVPITGSRVNLYYSVCETGGILVSYWNRTLFPQWCSHSTFDDTVIYNTMVRIAGSYLGFAEAFKAVAGHYGWTHIVLVSNDDTTSICWFGARSFDIVFGNDRNYTFTWLRFGSDPTDEQLDDILQQIRSLTRGSAIAQSQMRFTPTKIFLQISLQILTL